MALPFDVTAPEALYLAAALVAAAFVRGLAGFGFSAIIILLAALVTNPLPLLPVIFACEIGMTTLQARGIRAHVPWGRVLLLWSGAALAIVPSVAVMTRLDADMARVIIATLIFGLSLSLLSGFSFGTTLKRGGTFATGIASGMANSAGVGGLVAAAVYTAQPVNARVFRATLIVFLTGLDIMAMTVMGAHGLVDRQTGWALILAIPFLVVGIWIGNQGFQRLSPSHFRRTVILLLSALSILNIFKVIL